MFRVKGQIIDAFIDVIILHYIHLCISLSLRVEIHDEGRHYTRKEES